MLSLIVGFLGVFVFGFGSGCWFMSEIIEKHRKRLLEEEAHWKRIADRRQLELDNLP